MPEASILFVGDTSHDKAAADAANADCVFVQGGHNSASKLSRCGHVLKSLGDIVSWLGE
jgi:phosphoglycolate phosphatase-like HAD superfamily hydrolase